MSLNYHIAHDEFGAPIAIPDDDATQATFYDFQRLVVAAGIKLKDLEGGVLSSQIDTSTVNAVTGLLLDINEVPSNQRVALGLPDLSPGSLKYLMEGTSSPEVLLVNFDDIQHDLTAVVSPSTALTPPNQTTVATKSGINKLSPAAMVSLTLAGATVVAVGAALMLHHLDSAKE